MRLKDFRSIEESEVRFDAANITVVEGPNESGKSSIADALAILRLHKDSTNKSVVKNLKPVHRDVGTEIELEAQSGPYHFTYFKRYNSQRSTTLSIHEPVVESFTGDAAHERANAIFDETLDAQLWDALQITQGQSLLQPLLADIEPLKGALESTGEDPGGSGGGGLLNRVADERLRYFTETTGKPKGDYAAAINEVERLEGEVTRLTDDVDKADRLATQFARNGKDLLEKKVAQVDKAEQVADLEARSGALGDLRSAFEVAELTLAKAEVIAEAAASAATVRTTLVDELDAARVSRDSAAGQLAVLTTDLQPHIDRYESSVVTLGEIKAVVLAAAEASRLAADHLSRAMAVTDLASVVDRLQRADAARSEVQDLVTYLDTHSIDETVISEMAAAQLALTTAASRRDAVAPRLTVEQLGAEQVTVDGVVVDGSAQRSVVADTLVEVGGIVRVRVVPGDDAAGGSSDVADAEEKYAALLRQHHVGSLEAAQSASAERSFQSARLAEVRVELASALGDSSHEALMQQHATLLARVGSLPPVADDDTGDAQAADEVAEAAEVALETAVAEASAAQVEVDIAREARDAATQGSLRATQQAEMQRVWHDDLERRLTLARTRQGDDDVEARRVALLTELGVAVAGVDARRTALASADADMLEAELTNARGSLARLTTDVSDIEASQNQLLGQLEATGANGLQDEFDAATADLEDARRLLMSTTARARAARLLHATLSAHHSEAQRRYVAPFKQAIEALGATVFGKGFTVAVGPALTIDSRTLDGKTLPFDQLSGGTREQLAILGRLACAQLVDPAEGAPLVIDDAFGYADDDRLLAMSQVFNLVGQTAQIIILTCYPRRFQDIGNAHTVRLT